MDDDEKWIESWREQPLSRREIDMREVIAGAEKFQRKIRIRNLTEYLAGAVLVAWAAAVVAGTDEPLLVKVGDVLIALGGIFVVTVLRLRGRAAGSGPPLTAPTKQLLAWHCNELARQRDLLRGVPRWYLGPFLPGVVVVLVGTWLERPGQELRVALTALVVAVTFLGVALLNRNTARKLDEQIAELRRKLEP